MANAHHNVLYVGVTSELWARVYEHKNKVHPNSFTARYNVDKLVWYVFMPTIEDAIAEEKRIKGGSRKKKIKLIVGMNPEWRDLEVP